MRDVQRVSRVARLVAVTTVGGALLVLGIVLIPLPGPGVLVAVAGLAVLSIEYRWARRLRDEARDRLRRLRDYRRAHRHDPAGSAITPGSPEGPSGPGSFHQAA